MSDAYRDAATELADRVEAVLGVWVERVIAVRAPDAGAAAADAGRQAVAELVPQLRALLATDVEEQHTNPLALLRRAVRYPTGVLREAGVPPVARSGFDEQVFPDDVYDLTPATWSDIDPSLHEPGIVWGAAKAHAILTRRRP